MFKSIVATTDMLDEGFFFSKRSINFGSTFSLSATASSENKFSWAGMPAHALHEIVIKCFRLVSQAPVSVLAVIGVKFKWNGGFPRPGLVLRLATIHDFIINES